MAFEVFISFKRSKPDGNGLTRDYELAKDLHRTLVDKGVNVFFSERDLSSSAYVNEIYKALEEATILIVVGTRPEYMASEWVHAEWELFLTALLGKRKTGGEIYTYLEGMKVDKVPFQLFNRQSFYSNQKNELVARVLRHLGKEAPAISYSSPTIRQTDDSIRYASDRDIAARDTYRSSPAPTNTYHAQDSKPTLFSTIVTLVKIAAIQVVTFFVVLCLVFVSTPSILHYSCGLDNETALSIRDSSSRYELYEIKTHFDSQTIDNALFMKNCLFGLISISPILVSIVFCVKWVKPIKYGLKTAALLPTNWFCMILFFTVMNT